MSKPAALRGNVDALLTQYQALAVKEVENEPAWWWLSFSSDRMFLGVVIVFAHGLLEAVRICHEQNINPGGEVLGAPMPTELVPAEKYRNKILNEKSTRECTPGLKKVTVDETDTVEPWRPTDGQESNETTANQSETNTVGSKGSLKKCMIAMLPTYKNKARKHGAENAALTKQKPIALAVGGEEQSLPLRPQLQCPECAFENDNPEHLAKHLIESHSYSPSAAWYVAGQENERLYPRFRAPEGKFSVLGIDKLALTSCIIATYSTLDEAIVAADDEAGSYPEISVHDHFGKELYVVITKPIALG